MSSEEIIEKIMAKVEEFYMSDAEDSGEKQFNKFAENHAALFEGNFDSPEFTEGKLE